MGPSPSRCCSRCGARSAIGPQPAGVGRPCPAAGTQGAPGPIDRQRGGGPATHATGRGGAHRPGAGHAPADARRRASAGGGARRATAQGGRAHGRRDAPLDLPYKEVMTNSLIVRGQFMYPREAPQRLAALIRGACSHWIRGAGHVRAGRHQWRCRTRPGDGRTVAVDCDQTLRRWRPDETRSQRCADSLVPGRPEERGP